MRELLTQEVGHRLAALLVDDVDRLRDRGPVHRACIPGNRDATGLVVGEELEQHVPEAEERVRRHPVARRELLRKREKRPVGEVVAVDEEQLRVTRRAVVELELCTRDRLRGHAASLCRIVLSDEARGGTVLAEMRLELHPYGPEFLDDAARLLAQRHATQRLSEPGLPAAYEQLDVTREAIEEITTEHSSGAVATRGGEVVGYMLGTPREDPTWGPNVWVEPAGHAVMVAEDVRDLYALAAARWVEEGRTSHYAIAPAGDAALIDAWFRLGFGQQHVHAIREAPEAPLTELPDGLEIRRPTRDEIPVLAELELALPAHQHASPVFSALGPPPLEEAISEWEEDFDDPKFATFVAVSDGRVVGSAIGCSITVSGTHKGLVRPDNAGFLGFAAVLPDARGAGVGRALGTTVLDWAAAEGYPTVVTDWRATNLLSSRTWPSWGIARPSSACSAPSPDAPAGRVRVAPRAAAAGWMGAWLASPSSRAPGCRSSRWTTMRCS